MQADLGNCSSTTHEGWWLPNPALHRAAIPQAQCSAGGNQQLCTQQKGIVSCSHKAMLSSLFTAGQTD